MRFHGKSGYVCRRKCRNLNFDRLAVMDFIEASDMILSCLAVPII